MLSKRMYCYLIAIMTDHISFLNLFNTSGQYIASFLETWLPKIDEDWWEYRVLNNVPDFIKRNIENNGTIYNLDVAALLKILDANWKELSEITHLDFVMRNYAKEMQTIRNTWAHQSSENFSSETIERHLSTLYQFCKGLNAPQPYLDRVQEYRTEILLKQFDLLSKTTDKTDTHTPANNTETTADLQTESPAHKEREITIGTIVHLKADPSVQGAVINLSTTGQEIRYTVFINGKTQNFYRSQIELHEAEEQSCLIPIDEFNAHLTATQINNPNSQTLYSLNAAKIDFIPHQFRPVLKFIKADRPRLLIADGVGVGKTVEAGLILKELEARNKASKVLIICPKPLISERKWEEEMKIRFGESFTPVDGKTFRNIIFDADLDEWDMEKYGKIIIPYSLFTDDKLLKNKGFPGLLNLEIPPQFDLVIIDEAHHIRHSDTKAYAAVRFFVDNADAVVLLTATPIQMGNEDLYTLLNLIRPDLISDWEGFNAMSEPNQWINEAISEIRGQKNNWMQKTKSALLTAEKTSWGRAIYPANPVFKKVLNELDKPSLTNEERVSLLTDTESLHTFSSILNRTRRRDIGEYAVRKSVTISTPFTPEQREVYDEVLSIQSEILSRINPETPVAFMMNTLERRATSCLPGIIPFLKHILNNHLDEYDRAESQYDGDGENTDFAIFSTPIRERIENVILAANKLPKEDPKYDALLNEVLIRKKPDDPNKVMIFSTFRYTLRYLANRLFEDGFRVGVIHGGVNDEDRRYLREKFKKPREEEDALDVLLFSEVGCEGLDYQFCNCMVNYDLPWNPMKIEQRIGRIDRTGQKSEYVSIFNMITPETIDADIFDRCLMRIGVFESSIGENEIILGEIAREIQKIGENFTISEEERRRKLEQLADNDIRKYAEQEKLENEQAEFCGLALPKLQMEKEIEDATNFWLSSDNLENLIKIYLAKRLSPEGNFILTDKLGKKLRLNADYRQILLEEFKEVYGKRASKPEYRLWKRWLEGIDKEHKPFYAISFDPQNSLDTDADLITPVHPLVKLAVNYLKSETYVSTSFIVADDEVPKGKYPFAVYLWDYFGERKTQLVKPVCENPVVEKKLFTYLKSGTCNPDGELLNEDIIEKLDNVHYSKWLRESEEHNRQNSEFIRYRKESIRRSYIARLANIEDQINSASEANIRNMKHRQWNNVKKEYETSMREFENAESKAAIVYNAVGYGIVEVR